MKRRVVFVVVFLAFCNCAYAQWWKKLGGALLGGVADKYIQQCGYTPQESRQIISDVTSALGGNSNNVERGIDFMASDKNGRINMAVDVAFETTGELTGQQNITNQIKKSVDAGFAVSKADNEYEKANIIAGTAMDVVGDLTDGHAVTDKISAYVDANMSYLSDVSKSETVEDLQKAADKKNQAYTDLIVDIGMDLYDRKVAKEKAESQERMERIRQERENNRESGDFSEMMPSIMGNDRKSSQQISERSQGDGVQEEEKAEPVEKREVPENNDDTGQISVLDDGVQDDNVSERDIRLDLVDGHKNLSSEQLSESQKEKAAQISQPIVECNEGVSEEERIAAVQLKRIVVDDYTVNEVALSSKKCERLAEIAEILKCNPELRVNLVVYTSSEEKSKTIGYERAREAREYLLIRMGIGSERVFVKEENANYRAMAGKTDNQKRCIAITVFKRGASEKEIGKL